MRPHTLKFLSLTCALSLAAACGSDDDSNDTSSAGTGGSGASSGGGGAQTDGGNDASAGSGGDLPDGSVGDAEGGVDGACEPNVTESCDCTEGTGSRRCAPDGSGWSACFCTTYGAELAVSPTGSDDATGAPGDPFATLERAREEIAEIVAAGVCPTAGVVVWVHDGVYELDQTLAFGASESGTESAPIVLRGCSRRESSHRGRQTPRAERVLERRLRLRHLQSPRLQRPEQRGPDRPRCSRHHRLWGAGTARLLSSRSTFRARTLHRWHPLAHRPMARCFRAHSRLRPRDLQRSRSLWLSLTRRYWPLRQERRAGRRLRLLPRRAGGWVAVQPVSSHLGLRGQLPHRMVPDHPGIPATPETPTRGGIATVMSSGRWAPRPGDRVM